MHPELDQGARIWKTSEELYAAKKELKFAENDIVKKVAKNTGKAMTGATCKEAPNEILD